MSFNFDELPWVEAAENPFKMRCLDVRNFCWSAQSTTNDPQIAHLFVELRAFDGESLRGQSPANSMKIACQLAYTSQNRNFYETSHGAIFKATQMEDKWDIYLFDNWLYFTRSWDGQFCYKAQVVISAEATMIDLIEAEVRPGEDEVAEVDFLVKSHLYNLPVAHRIPTTIAETDKQFIAIWSFSSYGRRASFATYDDTTVLQI